MHTEDITVRQEGIRMVRVAREFTIQPKGLKQKDSESIRKWIAAKERSGKLDERWRVVDDPVIEVTSTEAVEHKVHTWKGKPTVVYSTDIVDDQRQYEDRVASPEDREWCTRHRVSVEEEYFHPTKCYVRIEYALRMPGGEEVDTDPIKFELTHRKGDAFAFDPQKIVLGVVLPLIKKELKDVEVDVSQADTLTLTCIELSNDIDRYNGRFNGEMR
jgi:hypothetical protein